MWLSLPLSLNRKRSVPACLPWHLFWLWVATVAAIGPHVAWAAQVAADTVPRSGAVLPLELGRPIERELTGGESHEYRLTLGVGQYAQVSIEQRTINVAVTIFGLDGKQIVDSDVAGVGNPETVSLIGDASGPYRVRVQSPDPTEPNGKYQITLKEVRAAAEPDRSRIDAEQAVAEGMTIYRRKTAEATRQAIQKHEEALAHWRAAREPVQEARTLYVIGRFYTEAGEKQKAMEFTTQALSVARAAGDRKAEAWALDSIGEVYENFGDKKKALEYYHQALPLRRTASDRAGEENTLHNLGVAYAWLGEKRRALGYFDEAMPICRELHDRHCEAELLNDTGITYGDLGDYQRDLELLNRAVTLHQQTGNRNSAAATLNNIGSAYQNLGEYQKALDAYSEALSIRRELGLKRGEAVNLNNIAWIYATLGDQQNALKYFNESAGILRRIDDRWALGYALSNVGYTHAALGDYHKALDFHQEALTLRRAVGDGEGEALTLNNIGNTYAKLGDGDKARDYYSKALTILRTLEDRRFMVATLRNLGALYREAGERQKSTICLTEALQTSRALRDRKGEAETLGEIAHLELDQGDLVMALQHAEQALAVFESLRLNVASPTLRASFFASARTIHELRLRALMQLHQQHPAQGFDAAALLAAEMGRARSLLELLAESKAEIRQGVDPALLLRERALGQAISTKAEQQVRLLAGQHTDEEAATAAKDLDAITTDYDQLQSTIREKSPRYAALTMPVSLGLVEIQQDVLDEGTLLLEYALGEEKSFLFAVTPDSLSSFELAKRQTIEAAARRVYDLLTTRNRTVAGETPKQKIVRVRRAEAEYPAAATALSRMLLGPVAGQLKTQRLLVVTEGALQYLPFAVLPEPLPSTPGGTPQPLVARHEILTAPSASVLALIRREISGRQPAEKLLAVLADPVFDREDPRIVELRKAAPSPLAPTDPVADALRSAAESGLKQFVRLRFTRYEAAQITRFAADSKKLTALDFAANRTTATNPDLALYRIVHFATHGLINSQHPQLSGLVLSLVNERGMPVDGFLRLHDIYNLRLGADLVVLSACQTALGKEIAGEGLIGLTRGFVYVGVPRVVASLWQIDDRATAELMSTFYQRMLIRGERPAAALRAAQLAIWKTKGWESPYYWAAFTLQGEWK